SLKQCLAAKDDQSAEFVVKSMADELGIDLALEHIQKQVQSGDPHWLMLAAALQKKRGDIPAARSLSDQLMAQMDKLSDPAQALVLKQAGLLYMIDPNPDLAKSKEIYLKLTKLAPDDLTVWNN